MTHKSLWAVAIQGRRAPLQRLSLNERELEQALVVQQVRRDFDGPAYRREQLQNLLTRAFLMQPLRPLRRHRLHPLASPDHALPGTVATLCPEGYITCLWRQVAQPHRVPLTLPAGHRLAPLRIT